MYINNEEDFVIFQRVYMKLIKSNTGTKLMKTSVVLPNLPTYAVFHEKILEIHEKTIHQGIQKTYETFKTKYYFPDAQKLFQNIINKCEICNLCQAEHRKVALPFEKTPETKNIRDKYVIDYYFIDQRKFLTCIDIHSKFISIIETKTTDWIESKKALLKIFNMIGKPKTIKMDPDPGLVYKSLQNWLQNENINIEITTSKNGIADIERVHKTINEKLRIINTLTDAEGKLMNIEKATYVYNHEKTHDTTGKTPAEIFL